MGQQPGLQFDQRAELRESDPVGQCSGGGCESTKPPAVMPGGRSDPSWKFLLEEEEQDDDQQDQASETNADVHLDPPSRAPDVLIRIPRRAAFEPGASSQGARTIAGMSEASVRVGAIREEDYELVLPLIAGYQRFYEAEPDDARNRAFFRRFLDPSEDGLLLGAWMGHELAGFATLYWTFSSTHAAEVALMNDLFVDQRHRGAGVGQALIQASVEAARRRGMRHLEWLTHVDNSQAQRLYERTDAGRSAWFGYEIRIR